jgi:hypothetical protein
LPDSLPLLFSLFLSFLLSFSTCKYDEQHDIYSVANKCIIDCVMFLRQSCISIILFLTKKINIKIFKVNPLE